MASLGPHSYIYASHTGIALLNKHLHRLWSNESAENTKMQLGILLAYTR